MTLWQKSGTCMCNPWPLGMQVVGCREQEQRAIAAEQTRLAERQRDTESLQRRLTHERRQHTSERRSDPSCALPSTFHLPIHPYRTIQAVLCMEHQRQCHYGICHDVCSARLVSNTTRDMTSPVPRTAHLVSLYRSILACCRE